LTISLSQNSLKALDIINLVSTRLASNLQKMKRFKKTIELQVSTIRGGILMIDKKSGVVKSFILFLILIMFMFSSIVSNTVAQEDTSHETLTIQMPWAFNGVDSRVWPNMNTMWVGTQYQGYLGMMAPGETTVTLPGIAQNWTCNDDRTEWTFTLREGVTFHNGIEIDAKTVKYSVEANYMAKKVEQLNISEAARRLLEIEGMNITFPSNDPNGNGRIVTFSGTWFPDPMFEWDVCGMWDHFMLVPYESHGRYTDDVATCQAKLENFSQDPISAGPYQFVNWVLDKYVLLERFDDWFGWGESFSASNGEVYTFPSLKNSYKFLNFSHVSNNALAVDQLISGKLDLITELNLNSDIRETINSYNNVSFFVKDLLSYDWISMNIQGDYPAYFGGPGNFPLSQVWFRQAVSHAINRAKLEELSGGVDSPRTTCFPDWLENKFPNLDTTDYYDFDGGKEKASALLDEADYKPLGFPEEPTNRFGWGVYANETQLDGVEQTRGRHFKLIAARSSDYSEARVLAIQNMLEQVGIFVDMDLADWETFWTSLFPQGDPGVSYNTTGSQPDPTFTGPDWDFAVGAWGWAYETPIAYLTDPWAVYIAGSFGYWYYLGWGSASWWNENFEISLAKIFGSKPDFGIPPPPDMPPSGYPVPVWENDDTQYIEACEQAGFEISKELPYIPLTFYGHAYAINNHIKNFKLSRDSRFLLAYSFWITDRSTDAYGIFIPLTVLFLLTIHLKFHKKRYSY
jgi:ABC-type transport system substrate-binding protein